MRWKRILRLLSVEALREVLINWRLPIIVTVVEVVATVVAGVPFWIIWGGSWITLAYVVWLMNWTSEWRLRNDVASKLTFEAVRSTLHTDGDGGPVTGISFGFLLRSIAAYPLEFTVTKINTQMGDRSPRRSEAAETPKTFHVPAAGIGYYDDAVIAIDNLESVQDVAWLDASVEFRRVNRNRAYPLRIKKRLVPARSADGRQSWQTYDVV